MMQAKWKGNAEGTEGEVVIRRGDRVVDRIPVPTRKQSFRPNAKRREVRVIRYDVKRESFELLPVDDNGSHTHVHWNGLRMHYKPLPEPVTLPTVPSPPPAPTVDPLYFTFLQNQMRAEIGSLSERFDRVLDAVEQLLEMWRPADFRCPPTSGDTTDLRNAKPR